MTRPLSTIALSQTISTHTLTWSVTEINFRCTDSERISTHTLTWSVTFEVALYFLFTYHFNSHAHVERDLYSGFTTGTNYHFNSHAHVERDKAYSVFNHCEKYFNSHAHVERDGLRLML